MRTKSKVKKEAIKTFFASYGRLPMMGRNKVTEDEHVLAKSLQNYKSITNTSYDSEFAAWVTAAKATKKGLEEVVQ